MKKPLLITMISLVAIILFAVTLNQVSKTRNFQFYGELVAQVETDEKVVALTFDDGPGENTEEILNILREEGVKGTFFLTGDEIDRYKDEATAIVLDGHEIGNHTYSHPRMIFKSPDFIREEIERTDQLIKEAGYEGEIHFRPPYGRKLFLLPYYLSQQERLTIMWNLEPETYPDIAEEAEKIVNYTVENIEPGSIILLHVMYESRTESLEAVKPLIGSLKDEGYTFVTVKELLEYGQ